MRRLTTVFVLTLLYALSVQAVSSSHDDDYDEESLPFVEILKASDFSAIGREAREQGKIIMLEMSSEHCGYCRTLEEEIIKPMLRSGDYEKRVVIRKLEIDDYAPMRNFDGHKSSAARIASQYNVFVTPTLVFLDGQGREVSPRILGVNSLDYFGSYVDEALEQGYRKIQPN